MVGRILLRIGLALGFRGKEFTKCYSDGKLQGWNGDFVFDSKMLNLRCTNSVNPQAIPCPLLGLLFRPPPLPLCLPYIPQIDRFLHPKLSPQLLNVPL
jgi:hypothetical protein